MVFQLLSSLTCLNVLAFLPTLDLKENILSYCLLYIYMYFIFPNLQYGFLLCALLQVLDGAGLDIDFHLASPEGKTLVFEQRKSDGVHT